MEEAYRWRVEVLAHPMVPLLVAVDEDERLCRVSLGAEREAIERDAERRGALVEKRRGVASDAARQLSEYLEGKRRHFDLELETGGTEFERAAWRALCEIPFGETKSYGEQAALLDRPGAARAVGRANGKNPIPIVVPCHRVIGADGSLTGFTGGLSIKRWLLAHEGRQLPLL